MCILSIENACIKVGDGMYLVVACSGAFLHAFEQHGFPCIEPLSEASCIWFFLDMFIDVTINRSLSRGCTLPRNAYRAVVSANTC